MSALQLCLLQQTLSPSARKRRPRAYAYYRCVGTDAYRFGGHRLCPNTQVRTDHFELAVWQEVCALLAHPERLAQEFTPFGQKIQTCLFLSVYGSAITRSAS
jgi:site-specific DNA recombinase